MIDARNAGPLPGNQHRHREHDDAGDGKPDQAAIGTRRPRLFVALGGAGVRPCRRRGVLLLVLIGRFEVVQLRLVLGIILVACGLRLVLRVGVLGLFLLRRGVGSVAHGALVRGGMVRAVAVARRSRRLRRLGCGAAEVARLADDVAKSFQAFLRQGLLAAAQQALAGGLGRAGRRLRGVRLRPGRFGRRRRWRRRRTLATWRRRRGGGASGRLGPCRRPGLGPQPARGLGFDLADRLFQRQALFGDFRFRQRRLDRTQLRHQRGPRPFVQRPTRFAGAVAEPFDSAGDERVIIGHRQSLRSVPLVFISIHASNGLCIRMVSSRSGLVESTAAAQPTSSSIRRTYLIACAGNSPHDRACAVFSPQPAMVS